ncbi:MAG TPA: hypothetical protein VHK68_12135 [Gemmatimonadales bacterium]|jgi:hypothetical protein|nr:hypothetical protein [Gemmatimonadales bacterium]
MQQPPEFTPPNLSRYTESLRREVYDRVVSLVWTSTGPDDHVPSFTPDQAGLMVFYAFGRWFATWSDLETVGPGSVERKTELVRVQESTDTRYGIILAEV